MAEGEEDEESEDSLLRAIARIDPDPRASVAETARPDGTRLGRFVVRGELGRGGMGIVCRAEDERLGRTRSAAALVHRNVAAVYDVGEADGELFIAMELGGLTRSRAPSRWTKPARTPVPFTARDPRDARSPWQTSW